MTQPTSLYMDLPDIDPPPPLQKRPSSIVLQIKKLENRLTRFFENYETLNTTNSEPNILLHRLTHLNTDLQRWAADSAIIQQKIPFPNEKHNPLIATMQKMQADSLRLKLNVDFIYTHSSRAQYRIAQAQLESSLCFPFCCPGAIFD